LAVPVKESVATVLLDPIVKTGVRPLGVLVTRAAKFVLSAAEKVSSLKVTVKVSEIEPLFAAASARVVTL
jgi:hypothetical protein